MDEAKLQAMLSRFSAAQHRASALCGDLPTAHSGPCAEPELGLRIKQIGDASRLKTEKLTQQLAAAKGQLETMKASLNEALDKQKALQQCNGSLQQRLKDLEGRLTQGQLHLNEVAGQAGYQKQLAKMERDELFRQLQQWKERSKDLQCEKGHLSEKLHQMGSEAIRLRERYSQLQADSKREHGELVALKIVHQSLLQQNKALDSNLRNLECEVKRLGDVSVKGYAHQPVANLQQLRQLKVQFERTLSEKNEQIERLRRESQAKKSRTKARKEQMRAQIQQLRKSSYGSVQTIRDLREEADSLQQRISVLRNSESELRAQLLERTKAEMALKEELNRANNEALALKSELRLVAAELKESGQKFDQLKTQEYRRSFEAESHALKIKQNEERKCQLAKEVATLSSENCALAERVRSLQQTQMLLEQELRHSRQFARDCEEREKMTKAHYEQLLAEFRAVVEQVRAKEGESKGEGRGREQMLRLEKLRTLEEIKHMIVSHKFAYKRH